VFRQGLVEGSTMAAREMREAMEGRAPQRVLITGPDRKEVTITVDFSKVEEVFKTTPPTEPRAAPPGCGAPFPAFVSVAAFAPAGSTGSPWLPLIAGRTPPQRNQELPAAGLLPATRTGFFLQATPAVQSGGWDRHRPHEPTIPPITSV